MYRQIYQLLKKHCSTLMGFELWLLKTAASFTILRVA